MQPRLSLVTLGVADLERATRFYAEVLKLPRVPMPDGAGVSFFELGTTWLSLFPRDELAADCGMSLGDSSGTGADAVRPAAARTHCAAGTVSAADAGVSAEGSGFPGFTLAHNLGSIAAVDALFAELRAANVKVVKEPQRAFWGGYCGYFADSEGFLWEVAWNPHFPHA